MVQGMVAKMNDAYFRMKIKAAELKEKLQMDDAADHNYDWSYLIRLATLS
jgi:hypothetical protein